jgi:heterotetrameric sarcosine oxidase delta subunit
MSTAPPPWRTDGPITMLLIPCPWCGQRDEIEFHYGGEAHIVRPADPDALDDAAWAEYLFMRGNPKGPFAERWAHSAGCRRWFNIVRDTATHRILAVYKIGDAPPSQSAGP